MPRSRPAGLPPLRGLFLGFATLLLHLTAAVSVPSNSYASSGRATYVRADTSLALADAAMARGDYGQAASICKQYLRYYPDSHRATHCLARALRLGAQFDSALDVYRSLVERFPDEPDSRVGLGFTLLQLGRPTDALGHFQWVIEHFPEYADAWQGLGLVYYRTERHELAADAFTQWIERSNHHPEAYLARARAYLATERYPAARADLRAARLLGADAGELTRLGRMAAPAVRIPPPNLYAGYRYQHLERGANWHEFNLTAGHRVGRGTVQGEYLRVHRFDQIDDNVGASVYLVLWRNAYTLVRGSRAFEAVLLPEMEGEIQLVQHFDRFAATAGYQIRRYSGGDVFFVMGGLTRYFGPWYLQAQIAVTQADSRRGSWFGLSARRFLLGPQSFVEGSGGWGRELVTFAAGPNTELADAYYAVVRGQTFFSDAIGAALAINYRNDSILGVRYGVGPQLLVRW